MPLALLLSPDDQAVSAITGVLEEMSVTCERPLDGVSAAKQLNSRNFDFVLVDCENLTAAKLIFDVCRRGKGGKNPIPIAIVDGRGGLPTAFRLGAELILTKPVAKDQARTTIRTAVSRVKKDELVTAPPETQPDATVSAAEPAKANFVPGITSGSSIEPPAEALALRAAASSQGTSSSAPAAFGESSAAAPTMSAAAAANATPVIADSTELVESEPAVSEPEITESKPRPEPVARITDESALTDEEKKDTCLSGTTGPVFSAYQENESKGRGRGVLAVVAIALVCGGLYAAWLTQPAFRTLVEPQIDKVLVLTGLAQPKQTPAPAAARPVAAPPAPAPASPASPTDSAPSSEPATTPAPANSPNSLPPGAAANPVAQAPAQVASASAGSNQPSSTPAPSATATAPANKVESEKSAAAAKPSPAGKDASIAVAVGTTSSGEDAAVVLSSKGAEKRLMHSVQPTYPASARATGAEGTVVLSVSVDENGKVSHTQVKDGNEALTASAIAAVKQWRYRPYLRDGKAVPFETIVLVDFQKP